MSTCQYLAALVVPTPISPISAAADMIATLSAAMAELDFSHHGDTARYLRLRAALIESAMVFGASYQVILSFYSILFFSFFTSVKINAEIGRPEEGANEMVLEKK